MKRLHISLLIVFISSFFINISAATLHFEKFQSLETLPTNEIQQLYTDREGYVWLATSSGLFRFDGYKSVIYKSNFHTPDLLVNNTINCVVEDYDNNLWIGTMKGVNRLNKKTGAITNVPEALNDIRVSGIIVTKRNEIFFGTDNGLYRYFVDNDSCVYMSGMTDGNARIPNTIKGLIEDSSGFIWIGSWVEGICKYDPLSGRIQSFPRLGNRNSAHTIFEDSKNRIWVGSWGEGLFLLDRDEYGLVHKWHNFRKGDKNSLLDDYVYCINEDINNSNIWIGTRSGLSVLKFDDDKPAFENYKPSKSNNSISYNEVNTIMRDNQNVMWIGSMGGGVNFVNAEHSKFKVNDLEELKDQYSTNSIRSIYKDRSDNVWIGLGSYGLFKYDVQKNKYFFFKDLPEFSHITRLPTINCISTSKDSTKTLIGTYDGGVYIMEKGKVSKLEPYNNNESDLCVYDIIEDNNGNYWFGTRFGLYYYENKTNRITKINENTLFQTFISLAEDKEGNIWGASQSNGIYKFSDIEKGNGCDIKVYNTNSEKITINSIQSIFCDSKNRIWVGTEGGGLFVYNTEKDCFDSMNDVLNYSSDVISSFEEDNNGNLWMGTNAGIINLIVSDNIYKSKFKIYSVYDGLPENIFLRGVSFKNNDGELFFGTHKGYISFYPEDIVSKNIKSPVVITDIKVMGESWSRIKGKAKSKISLYSPEYTNSVNIPYNRNNITIEFATLNFINVNQNSFAYNLEGFDNEWRYTDAGQHFANFNNLPAGTYKLRLKAANQTGIWNEREDVLTIKVLPAPWDTWWAYCSYLIIIATFIYLVLRVVRNRIILRNKIQLKELEKRQAEEITQAKLKFFTNISHELLTPLTIISASVDELKMLEPSYTRHYQVMTNNVNRLIRLLQQILEFRKAENGNLKLKVSQGELVGFIKNSIDSIEPLMHKKNIKCSFLCEEEKINGFFDIDKLDKILYNLLSNAAKYNNNGNLVEVLLSLEDNNTIAVIEVKDNGEGFTSDSLSRLFERFYEGNHRKFNTMGTGIGLSLTKTLAELHGGSITVDSEYGKGATFIVKLPITRDAFNSDEIEETLISDQNADIIQINQDNYTAVSETEEDNTDKRSILIVEDNEDLLSLMKDLFSKEYNVHTATNGADGYATVTCEDISLVVSDVMMPVMNGVELTQKLKSQMDYCHIPVILLTAKNTEEDRVDAYNAGADGYIAKPFNLNVLKAKIRNLLKSKDFIAKDFKKQIVFDAKEMDYTSLDESFIQKAIEVMHRHLDDADFDQNKFIEEMAVTKSTLYRKLKSLTGMNTSAFMRNIRLKAACQLLKEKKNIRISELAYAVGFSDPKYFTACFKKEFGVLPKEYVESDVNS